MIEGTLIWDASIQQWRVKTQADIEYGKAIVKAVQDGEAQNQKAE